SKRDWSSDVCSSDLRSVTTVKPTTRKYWLVLVVRVIPSRFGLGIEERPLLPRVSGTQIEAMSRMTSTNATVTIAKYTPRSRSDEIGRASCRDRGDGW